MRVSPRDRPDAARPAGSKEISAASVVLGGIGLVSAYFCCRWTIFIRSVDLGENDFAGLFYMLVECALLLFSGTLVLVCLATGITALYVESRKLLPGIATGIGVAGLALLAYGFVG